MPILHFLNGDLVPEEKLLISPRDLGFSRGYAVFDFLRTYHGHKPFMLKKHIDRLFNSAKSINLQIPWSKEQVIEWVYKTLDANEKDSEKVIRITISGGVSTTFVPPATPSIIIMIDPVVRFGLDDYENGVDVNLMDFQRDKAESKTTNYMEVVRHMNDLQEKGFYTTIYHHDGIVREGAWSNVFAVIDGKLLTPKSQILNGITRSVLLEILKLDIPVVEEDFIVEDLKRATEVFITMTGREIVPVTKIDGAPVGNGKVGAVSKAAMSQYKNYAESDLWQ